MMIVSNKSIQTDPNELTKTPAQISIWDGKEWLEISNQQTINNINENVGIAQKTADGKNSITWGDTKPDTAQNGDIWLKKDENGNYTIQVFNGSDWDSPAEANVEEVAKQVSSLPQNYYSAEQPTGTDFTDGSHWYELTGTDSNGNPIYTTYLWNSSTKAWDKMLNSGEVDNANQISQVKSDLTQAQSDITTNKSDIITVSSNLESAKTDLQTQVTQAQSDITTAQNNIKTNADAISDANGNISSLQSSASKLESDMTDAKGEISTLQQSSTEFKADIADNKGNISSLSDTVHGLSNTVNDNSGNISNLQTSVNGLKDTVSDNSNNISTLQTSATTFESDISSLQSDNTTNKQNISSLQNTANGFSSTVATLQTQVNNSAVGTNLLTGTTGTTTTVTNVTGWSNHLPLIKTNRTDLANGVYTARAWISPASHPAAIYIQVSSISNSTYTNIQGSAIAPGSSGYSVCTYTVPSGFYISMVFLSFTSSFSDSTTVSYREMKLELGSHATDYSANPADNATVTSVSTLSNTVDGLSNTVSNNSGNITTLQTRANGFDVSVGQLHTQVNNSAVGTNLLLGTSNPFTVTGSGGTNDNNPMYSLASTIAANTPITISYDVIADKSTSFSIFARDVWNNFGGSQTATTKKTHIIQTLTTGMSSDWSTTIGYRLDGTTATLTFSNMKLEKGTVATDWCLSPTEQLASTQSYAGLNINSNGLTQVAGSTSVYLSNTHGFEIQKSGSDIFHVDTSGNLTMQGNITAGNISGVNFTGNNLTLAGTLAVTGSISADNGNVVINSSGLTIKGGNLTIGDSSGNTTTYIKSDGTFVTTKGVFSGSVTSSSATITGGTLQVGSNFKVASDGTLTASNAVIAGNITSGNISGVNFIGSNLTLSGTLKVDGGLYSSIVNGNYTNRIDINPSGVTSTSIDNTTSSTTYTDLAPGYLAVKTINTSNVLQQGVVITDNSINFVRSINNTSNSSDWVSSINYDDSDNSLSLSSHADISLTPSSGYVTNINSTLNLKYGLNYSGSGEFDITNTSGDIDLKPSGSLGLLGGYILMESTGTMHIKADSGNIQFFSSNQLNTDGGSFWTSNGSGIYFWQGINGTTGAVVHGKSFSNTSLLSKKTNISKIDTVTALDKINQTNIYDYQFKNDVAVGSTKHYASYIIDDVNDVSEYTEPAEFLDEDKTGRDDGTLLAYAVLAIQELKKEIDELKTK